MIILPHMARLSRDFYVYEFTRSDTAREHGIEINVYRDSDEHHNLEALSRKTLQPVRDNRGPIIVTSGYRPPKVNQLVGGTPSSAHVTGEAADVYDGQGMDPFDLAGEFLGTPFDQLILEWDGNVVHVAHSRKHNRGEVLTRYHDGRSLAYVSGLHRREDL